MTARAKGLAGRFSSLPVVRKMMWVRLRRDLKPPSPDDGGLDLTVDEALVLCPRRSFSNVIMGP